MAAKNVLVLYSDRATHVGTVREYLQALRAYSHHQVWFAPATNDAPCVARLADFDAVAVHYSVRLSVPNHLSSEYAAALEAYQGAKLLFIQDEYDATETARRWIERLRFDVVFTCVPPDFIAAVYPRERFQATRFVNVLTGYVPDSYLSLPPAPDLADRSVVIGYRGRPLPYWYGDLGQEKIAIGRRMKALCAERGIAGDIEWSETARIYGDAWPRFIRSCRAMLASESGANVFDDDGSIRRGIEAALRTNPSLTYAEARERFIGSREGKVRMNQVSPKIFEAIANRTALVLFEGGYSGVLKPDLHFIPLKKDFSNVDEVFTKLADLELVRAMVCRAYDDVIASGVWSYRTLVAQVDAAIDETARRAAPRSLLHSITGGEPAGLYSNPGALRFLPSSALYNVSQPEPPLSRAAVERILAAIAVRSILVHLAKRFRNLAIPEGIRPYLRRLRRRLRGR